MPLGKGRMLFMDTIDPASAARVWQRVQGTPPKEAGDQGLPELIAQEWTDAQIYLQLSRRLQGKESAILRRMHEEEQSHTACLKGIYTLITGKHPAVKAPPTAQEDPERLLRRCYGREMRCLAQYEARASDPEYGQVFSRLAEQEREHCRLVLQILGNLQKK